MLLLLSSLLLLLFIFMIFIINITYIHAVHTMTARLTNARNHASDDGRPEDLQHIPSCLAEISMPVWLASRLGLEQQTASPTLTDKTIHLCFQARMSDESQLAPHPDCKV